MKYLFQLLTILIFSFLGEVLKALLPFPVPASVYGLLLLLAALLTRVVKLEQVEDTAHYLISVMPVFFIASSVSIINITKDIKGELLSLVVMAVVSTVAVMAVTGLTAQAVIRHGKKKREKERAHE